MIKSHNAFSTATWMCTAAFIGAATPALADLTSADVWEFTQRTMGEVGYDFSTQSVETSAGATTVLGLVLRFQEGPSAVSLRLDEVGFFDRGDGGVDMVVSDIPMAISAQTDDGAQVELTGRISFQGQTAVYHGTRDEITADWSAARTDVRLDTVTVDGETADIEATVAILDHMLEGNYTLGPDARTHAKTTSRAQELTLAMRIKAPSDPTVMKFSLRAENIATAGDAPLPTLGPSGLVPMGDGGSVATVGAFRGTFDTDNSAQTLLVDFAGQSGIFDTAVQDGQANHDVTVQGLAYRISGNMIPMGALEIGVGSSRFAVNAPTMRSDEPQSFRTEIDWQDITLSDTLWDQFDPTGALVRDPGNVRLSALGVVAGGVAGDGADPDAPVPMASIRQLLINELALSFLGAQLDVTGQINFETADPAQNPIPRPSGEIDITAQGVNALFGSLTNAGLLPQGQAGMMQMMLGMFASPGDTPDSLKSRIEFAADGSVRANGQRIR